MSQSGERICPTPSKIPYTSRREAVSNLKRFSGHMSDVRPYRCAAGHWHVTSQSRKAKSYRKKRKTT